MVRIWPHVHHTEGAFVAKLRKTGAPTVWRHVETDVGQVIDEGTQGDDVPFELSGNGRDRSRDVDAAAMGDAAAAGHAAEVGDDDAGVVERAVESSWGVGLASSLAPCQISTQGKHVHARPPGWAAFQQLPGFVRAGMRVASLHRGYPYLTQQAVTLLGTPCPAVS